MARFYDVPIEWKSGPATKGRGIGNNAAWKCKCGEVLLGPHEDLYAIPPCSCGNKFRVVRGKRPRFVDRVVQL